MQEAFLISRINKLTKICEMLVERVDAQDQIINGLQAVVADDSTRITYVMRRIVLSIASKVKGADGRPAWVRTQNLQQWFAEQREEFTAGLEQEFEAQAERDQQEAALDAVDLSEQTPS